MKLSALCATVLSIPILLLATPDESCGELDTCHEKTVFMQKTTKMSLQVNSDGASDDLSPAPTPSVGTPADLAVAEELSMAVQLRCTHQDGDEKCMCKELLTEAICAMRFQGEQWSIELPSLDTNGDGSLDSAEWPELGPHMSNQSELVEAPWLIADLIPQFVKAVSELYDGLLKHNSCTEVLEAKHNFWENAVYGSLLHLSEIDHVCEGVINTPDRPATAPVGLEEEEHFESEAKVGSGGATLLETDMSQLTGLDAAMSRLSTKDIKMIRHDIDISSIKHSTDINEYVNFSMFKSLGKVERVASKEIAFAGMAKSMAALLTAEFCHKDSWVRRQVGPTCKKGWYQGSHGVNSGLCYRHCNPGYDRFGEHCWQRCPAGFQNNGATCGKGVYPWEWVTILKDSYHSQSCSVVDTWCNECPYGFYQQGLFCLENCKPGYSCADWAWNGLVKCRDPLPHTCLLGCSSDLPACVQNQFEMIQGVFEAAVSTALLVITFGGSSAVVLSANSAKAAARQTAKNSGQIAKRVGTQTFKEQVMKQQQKVVRDAMKDNVKGSVEQHKQNLMVDYATSESETLRDFYISKFKEEESAEDRITKITKEIDPTGLANAIDGSTGDEVDEVEKQVANWLRVASFVDPTGITGAVAGILKHSTCETTWTKMAEQAEGEIKSPTCEKLVSFAQSQGCGLNADEATINCYLNQYSDLRTAFGTNLNAARCHWVNSGQGEGRILGCGCGLVADDATIECYLNRYSDLRSEFGTNLDAARCHWVNYGHGEGRILGCD